MVDQGPILFLDIDGVLIPGRAYFMASQTQPLISTFDPCVVGMINRLCADFGALIVIHSNWRNTEPRRIEKGLQSLQQHFVNQGIRPEYIHPTTPLCPRKMTSSRWHDICMWLDKHPGVRDSGNFLIIEDTAHPEDWEHASQVVQTNFDEGLTVDQYMDIRKRLVRYTGRSESGLLLPNSLITPGGG